MQAIGEFSMLWMAFAKGKQHRLKRYHRMIFPSTVDPEEVGTGCNIA